MKQPSMIEALLIYHILTKDEDKTEWIKQTITDNDNPFIPKIYYKCKKCGYSTSMYSHYYPYCGREAMRGKNGGNDE